MRVYEGFVFGGPLNEQYVANQGQTLKAVMSRDRMVDQTTFTLEAVSCREVLYHWERFAYTSEGKGWEWGCWVAEGYPRHRITDALNMILSLSRLMTGVR